MDNTRPNFDPEILAIADYVKNYTVKSTEAFETAYYNFLDSLSCAFQALKFPECTKLLGPIVPNAILKNGAHVPGTAYTLEPVKAAFDIGALIRWLDFNDTWLAAEWGHPSDNLGGILAVADYLNRQNQANFTIHDIFNFMIKAHEIQGVIALENSFNRVGLDHVILVKIATTAVVSEMLGASYEQLCNAISLAFVDGQSLRAYRHSPNTGSRKSWAAGDASSRGVQLALMALKGEMGYPSALSAKIWGFYDVSFHGKPFQFSQAYGTYVMENILFKISFPAEFHAQTAVECALILYDQVKNKLDDIDKIIIETQEAAMRIISKQGPLHNPADRDHCLEYMIAIGLIFGELTAKHYENDIASDPRIDQLRELMEASENKRFSQDYLDPNKRSIANSIQVYFKDGSKTEKITVEYPIGHRRRRQEGYPVLMKKFRQSVKDHFEKEQADNIITLCEDKENFIKIPIDQFISNLMINN